MPAPALNRVLVTSALSLALLSSCHELWRDPTGPGPDGPVLRDTFDDDAIDPSKWRVYRAGHGPTVSEVNTRLEIEIPADATGDGSWDQAPRGFVGGYVSAYQLRGDFDVRVNYRLLSWPDRNGVRAGLAVLESPGVVARVSDGSDSTRTLSGFELYLTHFGDGVHGKTRTDDVSGSLRLVRLGARYTGYYLGSAGWVSLHTGPAENGDVSIRTMAWSSDEFFKGETVKVAFDDFTVKEGRLIVPDSE